MAEISSNIWNSDLHWTNERHVHFLNSLEASFVRSMFGNTSDYAPLNRYLPDTFESTEESVSECADFMAIREKKPGNECRNSLQDQVVPQIENKEDGDKDRLEKAHHPPLTKEE